MPELPEVETVVRALGPALAGRTICRTIVRTRKLRNALDEASLDAFTRGRTVEDVRRRGKYIVVELSGSRALVLHLGMSGAFRVSPASDPPARHEHVMWLLSDGRAWRMTDARRFGMVHARNLPHRGADPDLLDSLGVDALDEGLTGERLQTMATGRRCPIKNFIMDQSKVAGLGNIYANEALFRARVNPARPAGSLKPDEYQTLVSSIRAVLQQALDAGGTTLRDYRSVNGDEGRFHRELLVYGKADSTCPACEGDHVIRRCRMAGRSTYYCPHCQV